jgi:hypothetical protein
LVSLTILAGIIAHHSPVFSLWWLMVCMRGEGGFDKEYWQQKTHGLLHLLLWDAKGRDVGLLYILLCLWRNAQTVDIIKLQTKATPQVVM